MILGEREEEKGGGMGGKTNMRLFRVYGGLLTFGEFCQGGLGVGQARASQLRYLLVIHFHEQNQDSWSHPKFCSTHHAFKTNWVLGGSVTAQHSE